MTSKARRKTAGRKLVKAGRKKLDLRTKAGRAWLARQTQRTIKGTGRAPDLADYVERYLTRRVVPPAPRELVPVKDSGRALNPYGTHFVGDDCPGGHAGQEAQHAEFKPLAPPAPSAPSTAFWKVGV